MKILWVILGLTVLSLLGFIGWRSYTNYTAPPVESTDPIVRCKSRIAALDKKDTKIDYQGFGGGTGKFISACYSQANQACVVAIQSSTGDDTGTKNKSFRIQEIGSSRIFYEKNISNIYSSKPLEPLDTTAFDAENKKATSDLNCAM